MENLIVAVALYIVIVAIAYRPKPTATDPTAPVEYFPEVEETTPDPVTPKAITIVEPLPVAAFKAPTKPIKTPTVAPASNLSSLSIRELKKMASTAKIKRYSTLTKAQLIQALS